MSLEGQKCCAMVRDRDSAFVGRKYPCGKPAKSEFNGKFFCGIHDQGKKFDRWEKKGALIAKREALRITKIQIADTVIETVTGESFHLGLTSVVSPLVKQAKALKAEIEALEKP